MKIEINVSNKVFYSLILIMVLVTGVGVYAYNSGKNPSSFGHSGEEIEVTLPDGQKIKLNDFVSNTLTSLASPGWPAGKYCIIQAQNQGCPAGFTDTSPAYNVAAGWEFIIGSGAQTNIIGSRTGTFYFDGGDLKFGNVQGQVWAFCCK